MDKQALIHNLGDFVDALGGFLVVRFFISDRDAIHRTIKALAVICAIQGICMVNEQITHVNVFGYMGGPTRITVRDGKLRPLQLFSWRARLRSSALRPRMSFSMA